MRQWHISSRSWCTVTSCHTVSPTAAPIAAPAKAPCTKPSAALSPMALPCDSKNAHVAYILAADPDDAEGESFNDGDYSMYINVTDPDLPLDSRLVKSPKLFVAWSPLSLLLA